MTAELYDPDRTSALTLVPPSPRRPSLLPVMLPSVDELSMMRDFYAKWAVESQCYEGVTSIAKAMQVILKGFHLGIDPMESLIQIVYTGRKMTIQAQLMISLANRSGLLRELKIDDPRDALKQGYATVKAVRLDRDDAYIGTFSVEDATTAGLWGGNVWKKYPGAMLVNRAVSLTLRRAVPEVLSGLYLADEVDEEGRKQSSNRQQRSNPPTITAPTTPSLPAGPEIPWHETSELAALVKGALKAGYLTEGQGAGALLTLSGATSWGTFATSGDARDAIKAQVEKMKSSNAAPSPAAPTEPPAAAAPAVAPEPPAAVPANEVEHSSMGEPPWWTNGKLIDELVTKAKSAGYIMKDQGAADLLKLIGKENWQGFANRNEAGLAVKEAGEKLKVTLAAQAPATEETAVPDDPTIYEVDLTRATYDGEKITFVTLKHGAVSIWSRKDLVAMTGESFASDVKLTEWAGTKDKPTVYTFDTLRIKYKFVKGKPKIVGAVPEIPF